jgi:subtilisin family serine protease/Leucine-rich repeat (LRR) protein/C1A family cysteine protease
MKVKLTEKQIVTGFVASVVTLSALVGLWIVFYGQAARMGDQTALPPSEPTACMPAAHVPTADAGQPLPAAPADDGSAAPSPQAQPVMAEASSIPPQATPEPAPDEPAPPSRIILHFQPDTTEQERTAYIEAIGGTTNQVIDALDAVAITVPETITAQPLPESPVVVTSEPDYPVVALDEPPNDPRYPEQWALPVIGAPGAWEALPANAPTVVIAVIDSGICAGHPDLSGRIVDGWDFVEDDAAPQDDFGHGCSVAGVIAANVDNGEGIAGVAPNATIMPLRVLDADGVGSYSDVAAGIVRAVDGGAAIINLSLGGYHSSEVLEEAVGYAASHGVTVVAAAGNTGDESVMYPAAYAPVIAVGSVDPDLSRSSFSTYGAGIDLWAPGSDILTTGLDGGYTLMTGTSLAAPHVTGVAALEMALGGELAINGGIVGIDGGGPIAPEPPEPSESPDPIALNMTNPAATYCTRVMGYEYRTVDGPDGQDGICVLPDGSECDQWDFYAGLCGQDYSYCAQQGYGIETRTDGRDPFSPTYGVCISSRGETVESVSQLSGLSALVAEGCGSEAVLPEAAPIPESVSAAAISLPASFDWRSFQGANWLTSVKNQSSCGSCWAFAAVGSVEAAYNISTYNPALGLNLSEEYLISDCFSWGSCCGGSSAYAMLFMQSDGIPDDACMTYADQTCSCSGTNCSASCAYHTYPSCSNRTCSQRCPDWASRLTFVDSVWGVSSGGIREALIEQGPIVTYMGIGSEFGGYFDSNNIYRCTNDGGVNHGVVIVGYNETGGYWIVRNSWGTGWGDGGYFRVGYGECHIGTDNYLSYPTHADWTFMVYLDGDNNLEAAALGDFLEMSSAGSAENVNVVVQLDRNPGHVDSYGDWTDTRRFRIFPGMTPTASSGIGIGEANMGDPQTLISFVQWSMLNYPADHYALVLWDHGSGWRAMALAEEEAPLRDIAIDDSSNGDALTMPEIRSALSTLTNNGASPIDLVGFDACLMGMIEVDDQLTSYASVRVGSEDLVPNDGWPYDAVIAQMASAPTPLSAEALGTLIVDEYYASYGNDDTQSAVDLGAPYSALTAAVDGFAAALRSGVGVHYLDIAAARPAAQSFDDPAYIDLYDFAYQVNQTVTDPTINAAATSVMAAVDSAVIHEHHGASWPGAHGISIYFPETLGEYNTLYDGSRNWLRFTGTTQWDEWLRDFYTASNQCGDLNGANNDPAHATPIHYGMTVANVDICPVGDVDYYRFTGSAGDTLAADIDAEIDGSSLDSVLDLYGPNGTTLLASNNDYNPPDLDSRIEYTLPADGTYYLRVRDYDYPTTGGRQYFYTLTLTSVCHLVSEIPEAECMALETLYTGTGGTGWTHRSGWLDTATPCGWDGLGCNGGHVTGIDLHGNGLNGSLSSQMADLTGLQTLYLYDNQLSGGIPPEIGSLSGLQHLGLENNALTGNIPIQVGDLSGLQSLDLSGNQLNGGIPAELGSLSGLQGLWLDDNQLTGGIPSSLGGLSGLQYLYLDNNQLSGGIPAQLGNLSGLLGIDLSHNQLDGTIPSSLGSPTGLQELLLDNNLLTGDIPTQLGSLANLQILSLGYNQLSGNIPTTFGGLSALEELSLNNNHLDGGIPAPLGSLTALQHLDLSTNQLGGNIPPELGSLSSLQELYLGNNALEGEVPSALTGLGSLTGADFGYNMLMASEPGVATWLSGVDPDWAATQTIPPATLQATGSTLSSVTLSWAPITYTADGGYYQIAYAQNPGGPYTAAGHTTNKATTSYVVTSLEPNTPYYFVVRAYTPAHGAQQNALLSLDSPEASASTPPVHALMEDRLGNLYAAYQAGGLAAAQQVAQGQGLPLSGSNVMVIVLARGDPEALAASLRGLGATIQGPVGSEIHILLPINRLVDAANLSNVGGIMPEQLAVPGS